MSIPIILIIAISLSMDAFSLALIYGTLNLDQKLEITMSIIVGIFHFFMPLLGFSIGKLILSVIKINLSYIVGIIFIVLGVEMLFSINHSEKIKILTNIFSIIAFAFTVSIDSFSTGIALGAVKTNIIVSCLLFSVISCTFTYLGLVLGKKLSRDFGKVAIIIGSVILLVLGVKYLI